VAVEPKRYLVTFCDREVAADRVARLEGLVAGDERFEVHGRELFAWLPDGVARSKLATAMAKPARDVIATARNWTTVLTLLSMARELG
jgi:uncharacterized protein (DUF1697 family)